MRPLNIFQRVMRIWEEAHPYNAAQVMEVAGDLEAAGLDRITWAWNETLAATGLGLVRVEGGRFAYERAQAEVQVVDDRLGLEGHITRELNRPFGDEVGRARRGAGTVVMPFRAFAVRGRPRDGEEEGEGKGDVGKPTHFLGVVYAHWVADSVAMRMVMREWFCRLYDPDAVRREHGGAPLRAPEGGFWRYFGPSRCGWSVMDGTAGLLESMSDFARARRLHPSSDEAAQEVECTFHRLPEGMVEELVEAARASRHSGHGRGGVTLNDMILAALARAIDAQGAVPASAVEAGRRNLAMGTIVDLRAMTRENMLDMFGMFLGFTSLVVPAELLRDRQRLLAWVGRESLRQKECRAAAASVLRMGVGYGQGRFLTSRQLAAFYRTYMPILGGVSNVNMNRSWAAKYHPWPLVDYVRVAPTGPMVPVVVAVTTMGKRLSYVLTRRKALVDAQRGRELVRVFQQELTGWAKTG